MASVVPGRTIVIPGVEKGGTTTLYDALVSTTWVTEPRIKETQFLALPRETVLDNFEWYLDNFSPSGESFNVDASTLYFWSDNAVRNIREFIEKPRIIIILRDPAKRAFSAYLHMYKRVPQSERRTFEKIMEALPDKDSWEAHEERGIRSAIDESLIDEGFLDASHLERHFGVRFRSVFEDPLVLFRYMRGSVYSEPYERYRETFKDDVMVVFLEKLVRDPKTVFDDILEFLSLPEGSLDALPHSHKTIVPKNDLSRSLIRVLNSSKVIGLKRALQSRFDITAVKSLGENMLFDAKPHLEQEYYQWIREAMSDEYEYWFKIEPELESLWKY
ncbi:MAG: sulfotransferase domain-containing protein [Deltaproteobacteria bacterium]|nr:sulfotransferase domain-containing protein [Deltaproteobacteria bacterium]